MLASIIESVNSFQSKGNNRFMSKSGEPAVSKSTQYAANRLAQLDALENVRALEKKVVQLSGRQASRFHDLGKLLPRERVDQLLDPGSEFLVYPRWPVLVWIKITVRTWSLVAA